MSLQTFIWSNSYKAGSQEKRPDVLCSNPKDISPSDLGYKRMIDDEDADLITTLNTLKDQ